MRMKKKITTIFCVFALALSMVPSLALQGIYSSVTKAFAEPAADASSSDITNNTAAAKPGEPAADSQGWTDIAAADAVDGVVPNQAQYFWDEATTTLWFRAKPAADGATQDTTATLPTTFQVAKLMDTITYQGKPAASALTGIYVASGTTQIITASNITQTAGQMPSSIFSNMASLKDITGLAKFKNTDTSFSNLFREDSQLSDFTPIKNWDTSNVTNLENAFENCDIVDASFINSWDTSNVTSLSYTFYGNEHLDVYPTAKDKGSVSADIKFSTAKVTNFYQCFSNCSEYANADFDTKGLAHWDVSKGADFRGMFSANGSNNPNSLKDFSFLDSWEFNSTPYDSDTRSNGLQFGDMFYYCVNLTKVPDCFNTTATSGMQGDSTNPLRHMQNAILTTGMFEGCTSLIDINNAAYWDLSNSTYGAQGLSQFFDNCPIVDASVLSTWKFPDLNSNLDVLKNCNKLEVIGVPDILQASNLEYFGDSFDSSDSTNLPYLWYKVTYDADGAEEPQPADPDQILTISEMSSALSSNKGGIFKAAKLPVTLDTSCNTNGKFEFVDQNNKQLDTDADGKYQTITNRDVYVRPTANAGYRLVGDPTFEPTTQTDPATAPKALTSDDPLYYFKMPASASTVKANFAKTYGILPKDDDDHIKIYSNPWHQTTEEGYVSPAAGEKAYVTLAGIDGYEFAAGTTFTFTDDSGNTVTPDTSDNSTFEYTFNSFPAGNLYVKASSAATKAYYFTIHFDNDYADGYVSMIGQEQLVNGACMRFNETSSAWEQAETTYYKGGTKVGFVNEIMDQMIGSFDMANWHLALDKCYYVEQGDSTHQKFDTDKVDDGQGGQNNISYLTMPKCNVDIYLSAKPTTYDPNDTDNTGKKIESLDFPMDMSVCVAEGYDKTYSRVFTFLNNSSAPIKPVATLVASDDMGLDNSHATTELLSDADVPAGGTFQVKVTLPTGLEGPIDLREIYRIYGGMLCVYDKDDYPEFDAVHMDEHKVGYTYYCAFVTPPAESGKKAPITWDSSTGQLVISGKKGLHDIQEMLTVGAKPPAINRNMVTSVKLEDMEGLTLPSDLFSQLPNLDKLDLSQSGLTSLPSGAFAASGMSKVVIPSTMTDVSSGAFAACDELLTVQVDVPGAQDPYPSGIKKWAFDFEMPKTKPYKVNRLSVKDGTISVTDANGALNNLGSNIDRNYRETKMVQPLDMVKLTPNAAASGKHFSNWVIDGQQIFNGGGVSGYTFDNDGSVSFKMPDKPIKCMAIYVDDNAQSKAVTIDGDLEGGTITVNPTSAKAGDKVTITVTPDAGKKLQDGSLKVLVGDGSEESKNFAPVKQADGTYTFIMPDDSVSITATFVDGQGGGGDTPTPTPTPGPDAPGGDDAAGGDGNGGNGGNGGATVLPADGGKIVGTGDMTSPAMGLACSLIALGGFALWFAFFRKRQA